MKLIHISHTDLDGFTCQLISKEFFKNKIFFNANYGPEVILSIQKAIEYIKNSPIEEKFLFIISDLNLTFEESTKLDQTINELKEKNYNITLQILDHHKTGEKSANTFSWYHLDTSKCATKIVYEFLQKNHTPFNKEKLKTFLPLINAVNAVDIWLEDETENFEYGKVLMSMLVKAREINNILFSDISRNYKIYLLEKAVTYLYDDNKTYIDLDDNIHFIKKEYFINNLICKNDSLDNLSAKFLVKTINDIKESLTVNYRDHKGILTYCLGSISIPANAFLKANKDYDFFIDLGKKGNASFRADGILDVSNLASRLANGGGHPNASGAKFKTFRETPFYTEAKKFIQNKLNELD